MKKKNLIHPQIQLKLSWNKSLIFKTSLGSPPTDQRVYVVSLAKLGFALSALLQNTRIHNNIYMIPPLKLNPTAKTKLEYLFRRSTTSIVISLVVSSWRKEMAESSSVKSKFESVRGWVVENKLRAVGKLLCPRFNWLILISNSSEWILR